MITEVATLVALVVAAAARTTVLQTDGRLSLPRAAERL
jgi:hypothetical protein